MKLKILMLLMFAFLVAAACKNSKKSKSEDNLNTSQTENEMKKDLAFSLDSVPAEPVFDIVTSLGTIRVKLYEDTPKHRDNFVKLASQRFYDGILFHRIIPNFMIQGGDPQTKNPSANPNTFGQGGPGYEVPAEILPNHTHKKGALCAARKGDVSNPEKKSSGSQFYLVQDEVGCSHLDGQYTIFGETISGIDIIDAIAAVPTDKRDLPTSPVKILRVDLVRE